MSCFIVNLICTLRKHGRKSVDVCIGRESMEACSDPGVSDVLAVSRAPVEVCSDLTVGDLLAATRESVVSLQQEGDSLNAEDLKFFRSWLGDFIESLYLEDDYIRMNAKLKEDHTHRVCTNVLMIGNELSLDETRLLMGETIALFHDIGRFEQIKKYRTFNDALSENHAGLSAKILKRTGVLDRLAENDREVILKAVGFHNARTLPKGGSDDTLFQSKLIRDADKLDIFYIVTDYYKRRRSNPNPAVELDLPDTPEYSMYIIDDIMHCRCADGSGLKTYNDMKLFELSWVFDVNFLPTILEIKRRGYIDRIVEVLPSTGDIRMIHEHINNYISGKL